MTAVPGSSALNPLPVAWDLEREARGARPDPPFARCPEPGCPAVAETRAALAVLVAHVRQHKAEDEPDKAPVTFAWPVPPPGVTLAHAGLATAAGTAPQPAAAVAVCACGCGLPVIRGSRPGRRFATDACRKRQQRRLERASLAAFKAAAAPEPKPAPWRSRAGWTAEQAAAARAADSGVTSAARSLASVS